MRDLERLEIGTGVAFVAFVALYALGAIDAVLHYDPRVIIRDTAMTISPVVIPGAAFIALSWSR